MLSLGHEFEDHMYPILLSDWSILILTYFYRIFTAKKWNFTTKSDLFRKKTIPIGGILRFRRCFFCDPTIQELPVKPGRRIFWTFMRQGAEVRAETNFV